MKWDEFTQGLLFLRTNHDHIPTSTLTLSDSIVSQWSGVSSHKGFHFWGSHDHIPTSTPTVKWDEFKQGLLFLRSHDRIPTSILTFMLSADKQVKWDEFTQQLLFPRTSYDHHQWLPIPKPTFENWSLSDCNFTLTLSKGLLTKPSVTPAHKPANV